MTHTVTRIVYTPTNNWSTHLSNKLLFSLSSALIALSVILVYSLATYVTQRFHYSDMHFFFRQMGYGLFSIFIMWYLSHRDPEKWLKPLGFTLFIGGFIVIIAMPFLPDFMVREVGGAKRWIKLMGVSISPVEFFKVGFIYFLAWSFSRKLGHHGNMGVKQETLRFIPYMALFFVIMLFIAAFQKELGQVTVIGASLLVMLFFAGSSAQFILSIIMVSLTGFVLLVITQGHRITRIKSWWGSVQDDLLSYLPNTLASYLHIDNFKEPYQVNHSLNAISNGGLFGTGLSNGQFKLGFLSEVHTDFILAGLAEEFGFIGVFVVSIIFLAILFRILQISAKITNPTYHLFTLGFALIIAFTFLLNAYGIRGLIPIKGIPIPFLSYGGSSMIATAIGMGMVMMIAKRVKV